jgi:ABC-2 type transport system ATP-binding protein
MIDTATGPIVRTQDLTKSYKGVAALKGLNLNVPEHSIFGFLGPNGAGKTTTIKLLLGLTRPTSGTATLFGQDVVADSLEIRRRVGYLGQDPQFYDNMTARETLRYRAGFYYSGTDSAIHSRVAEVLDLVGLSDRADRPVKGFSGGERQRLGIGQALINSPDLLILDEPAAALDPMGRRDVLDIMRKLREQTTIFYSTHILDDVQRVSDTVAIMNHGELLTAAPIEDLLAGSGVAYFAVLRGDTTEVHRRVLSMPWVESIDATRTERGTTWEVRVNDSEAADSQLGRLLASDEHVTISSFGKREWDLEQVFMGLVEGTK